MKFLVVPMLAFITAGCISLTASAQQPYWSSRTDTSTLPTDKSVARSSFPKVFKLFSLDMEPLRQQLFSVVDMNGSRFVTITLPDANGSPERFRVCEASNFEPALQARFPEIRAFSGQSMDDPGALLKISISPRGIQSIVFRNNGRPGEYIEPYSEDHTVYAVFKSQQGSGALPWVCTTPDHELAAGLINRVNRTGQPESNAGLLKTLRLALSCNARYANFFGATGPSQVALVIAAFNATLTRCNGIFERDLAVHLNLIPATEQVIYYSSASDPYGGQSSWNIGVMTVLKTVIGDTNFDIGQMFGIDVLSTGGGNASCIGCVCDNGNTPETYKGAAYSAPIGGIPQGYLFDISLAAHEFGHQLGGSHTLSNYDENLGTNKEPASGITIMGYAGISPVNTASAPFEMYHQATIEQIQANLIAKTCPVTTSLTGINAAPVIAALSNYTIPPSTPFALRGAATDADPGDVLTYCWEQNDNGVGQTGINSIAYESKPSGPNWISFPPANSPERLLPRLSTILTGENITGPLPGGYTDVNVEALSNISRTLNFRLTVRDNRPYNGTAVGQTSFRDMLVTVDASSFTPFLITSQNSPVSYAGGSTQTLIWSVGNTTAAPISVANVRISWSTDNGTTFTTLIESTANDGTETFVVPPTVTTQARIRVEAIDNIFFDINNAAITVTLPVNGFTFGTPTNGAAICQAAGPVNSILPVSFRGTYSGPVTVAYLSGAQAGTTVSVNPSSFTANGTAIVSLSGTSALAPGTYTVTIQGNGPAPGITQTALVSFIVNPGSGPVITSQPVNTAVCSGSNASFSVIAPGTYQWQVSTLAVPIFTNITGATASTLSLTSVTTGMSGNQYRCIITGQCGNTNSNPATLTVSVAPVITINPVSQTACAGNAVSFTAVATGTPSYQWKVRSLNSNNFVNIPESENATANQPVLRLTGVNASMNWNEYICSVWQNNCQVYSLTAYLQVSNPPVITVQPAFQNVCPGRPATLSVLASGTNLHYQWQWRSNASGTFTDISPVQLPTAQTASVTLYNPTTGMTGFQYRCKISSDACELFSNIATLVFNTPPAVVSGPASVNTCMGTTARFTTTATGTNLHYQWMQKSRNMAAFENIQALANPSAVTNQLIIGITDLTKNGSQYKCIVYGDCYNPAAESAVATLIVTAPVTAGNILIQPAPLIICAKQPARFLVAADKAPAGYQWQVKTPQMADFEDITGVPSALTSYLQLQPVSVSWTGNKYRCKIMFGMCGQTVFSNSASLEVRGVSISPPQQVCTGNNAVFHATVGQGVLNYQWFIKTPYSADFIAISTTANPSAGTQTLTISNVTGVLNNSEIRCRVSYSCGSEFSQTSLLTVVNPPVISRQPFSVNVCGGGNASFSVVVSSATVSYQWWVWPSGAINPMPVTGNTTASSPVLVITGVSTSAMNRNRYYCKINSEQVCPVTSDMATLYISPMCRDGNQAVQNKSDSSVSGTGPLMNPADSNTFSSKDIYIPDGVHGKSAREPEAVFIYPVPNAGSFNIKMNTGLYPSIDLKVYDQSGRLIVNRQVKGLVAGSVIPVVVPHAANGLYQLYITSAIKPETGAIIKTFIIADGNAGIK